MAEDEVKQAWEKAQARFSGKAHNVKAKKEKKKTEEETDKKAKEVEVPSEEENLEGSLIPEEREEFSKLPSRAPSLELTGATQNLESTIGPFFGGEEEKEEKVSYSGKKKQTGYFGKGDEEEIKYERPVIESPVEFAAPTLFKESDITQMARMAAPQPEKHREEREYVSMDSIELKELEHEKLRRERGDTVKKYKPHM